MHIGIKDVAQAAQVSIGTVSKIFNPDPSGSIKISAETRTRVLAAAQRLNYTPNYGAKLLRGQSTKTIGFTAALPEEHICSWLSDYSSRILNGLGEEAQRHGYQLLIINGRDYQYYMDINRIDGLVMLGYSLDNNPRQAEMHDIFRRFAEKKYPYIVLNNSYRGLDLPQINIDNVRGMELIAEHIVSRGYRRIGFIGEITPNPQRHHTDRAESLKTLLRQYGLPVDESLFLNGVIPGLDAVPRSGNYSHRDGYCGLEFLTRNRRPVDCLVCGNDTIALGVMKYAHEHRIAIPGELAVIGFDDMVNAEYFTPSITTVRQPLEDFGRMALQYLLRKMAEPDYFEQKLITPELMVRESA